MQTLRVGLPILLATFAISGCASTHVEAFRDPDFLHAHYSRLAVFAEGMRPQAAVSVEEHICHDLAQGECVTGVTVLPPTRVYSAAEMDRYLRQDSVDAVLIVSLSGDQGHSTYVETIQSGQGSSGATCTGMGNTATCTGSGSSSAVTTPIYVYHRAATGWVTLYDRASEHVAWRGTFNTSGSGRFGTTDGAFISSASSTIAKKLQEAHLVDSQ